MITGTKELLNQYVVSHRCPDHEDSLVVAWHAGEDSYVIRCGHGHYPEEIVPLETKTQLYKRDQIEAIDPDFNLLPDKDLGSDKLLTQDQIWSIIIFARKYDLDPYRGHVVLMYGKPYIGLDGYFYHADRTNKPYQLKSRPLTTPERSDYQVNEGDHAWIANLNINHGEGLFQGLGIVTRDEMTAKSTKTPGRLRSPVVAAHPWQLAQKRAEWQALRRAFPIGESDKQEEV